MVDHGSIARGFAASLERRRRSIAQAQAGSDGGAAAAAPPSEPVGRTVPRSSDAARSADLLRAAEELAALSGWVDPDRLFAPDVEENLRRVVLNRLVPACSIAPAEGETRWLLLQERRRSALARLVADDRLQAALAHTLPPTDLFGEMIREVLARGDAVPLDRGRDQQLALLAAIEATAGVAVPRPDAEALRQLIGSEAFLADYKALLDHGFFGRIGELDTLRHFLEAGNSGRTWGGLIVTGLGGAGKSTLLAQFALGVVKDEAATVVVLDFDRPGIDPNDRYWLEGEISRQVGQQHRGTAGGLRDLRREVRRDKVEAEGLIEKSSAESVVEERSLGRVLYGVKDALLTSDASTRPFLLILDTFEEATQRDLEGGLLRWLDEVGERLWPLPLRVIFSGRLYGRARDALKDYGVVDCLELSELEPEMAEAYLGRLGVPAAAAARLAHSEILPRRPLELKLFARLINGPDCDIDELEDELRSGGGAAGELFAGLVYRRVLLRLGSGVEKALAGVVQSLASPGLVLRYVTTDLIQRVLAPALKLRPLDDETARRALDALASFGWLVTRADDGKVWHRRDLRRLTLKAMTAKEPEKAARIHRRAARYFAVARSDDAPLEALYHRLMLLRSPGDMAKMGLAEVRQLSQHLGPDVVDLPSPAAALIRFAAGQALELAALRVLPIDVRGEACRAAGRLLTESREFGKALAVHALLRDDPATAPTSGLDDWEAEVRYATASWDELAATPRQASSPPDDAIGRLTGLVFPSELIGTGFVAADQLAQALSAAASPPPAAASTAPTASHTRYQRLALGLVLADQRGALSAATRAVVAALIQRIRRDLPPLLSATLDARLFLLDGIAATPTPALPRLWLGTLNLSPAWLETITPSLVGTAAAELAATVAAALGGASENQRATVSTALGAVDALAQRTEWLGGVPLKLDWATMTLEAFVALLRGPDPEFRDACRFALLEAFPDRDSHPLLGEIIASVAELPPADRDPGQFAAAIAASPEHALASYVEFVDRSWALGALLQRAHDRRPESRRLGQVLDAHRRWDAAVRDALSRVYIAMQQDRRES